MKTKHILAALGGAAAIAAGLALWAFGPQTGGATVDDTPRIALAPDDPAAVARGAALYATHCASCHGAALEGQENWRRRKPDGRLPAPPHDAGGHTWHHSDSQLFALTKQGPAALVGGGYQSDMPGYDGILTDREILDTLSFIKSRWPERVREQHDRINAAAAGSD
ncbi:MAG: c-type cytochrome [Sneathiellaceae bacterium]